MKKLLFLSNGTKPSEEQYNYVGEEKLTNFSIPIVNACKEIGIDVTVGINRKNASQMTCQYPVTFYNAEIYRNPFNFREVWRAYKNACEELKKGDYIGIHCNTPIGGLVGRLAGKRCKIDKVIYTAHGFHFYKGAPKINWLLYYPIEKWLAHYTDALITINKEDFELAKSKLKLRNKGKVYYVPGVGIDPSQYNSVNVSRDEKRRKLGIPLDAFVMISAGDLNNNKNNTVIISAMEKLKRNDIHYVLCGVGPLEGTLREQAEKAGLERNVHFLGYRTDIKELYQMADCFVMPSYREGLSRSIMEAMASGLPCIVSKIRGNVDMIDHEKLLCEPNDPEAFSSAMLALCEDHQLRTSIATYNKKKVEVFSIDKVESEIKSIYQEQFEEMMTI